MLQVVNRFVVMLILRKIEFYKPIYSIQKRFYLGDVDAIQFLVLFLVAGVAHDCAIAVGEDVGHLHMRPLCTKYGLYVVYTFGVAHVIVGEDGGHLHMRSLCTKYELDVVYTFGVAHVIVGEDIGHLHMRSLCTKYGIDVLYTFEIAHVIQ
jgi:hypothetical protein